MAAPEQCHCSKGGLTGRYSRKSSTESYWLPIQFWLGVVNPLLLVKVCVGSTSMTQKVGIVSATLAPMTGQKACPPHTYLGIANSMLQGVRVLATTSPLPALPLAMIGAHALECTLKAYLSRSGDDSCVRGRHIRHNLNALWLSAVSDGLTVQPKPPHWADCLSLIHNSPHFLRYSTGIHGIQTPAPEPMSTELGALFEQVCRQLCL